MAAFIGQSTTAGRTALYNAMCALTHEGKPWAELRERLTTTGHKWREQKHSKFAPAPAPVALIEPVDSAKYSETFAFGSSKTPDLTDAQRRMQDSIAEARRIAEREEAEAQQKAAQEAAQAVAKVIAANEAKGIPDERPTVLAVTRGGSVEPVTRPTVAPPKAMIATPGGFAKAETSTSKRTTLDPATGDCIITTTTRLLKGSPAWCDAMVGLLGKRGVQ